MAITHNAVVVVPDDGTSPVGSDEWNAAHDIEAGTITDTEVAAANKDGAAGTASMRTLGTGAAVACAGNDARLLPTGAEMMWPVATPPTGWLIEDGSSQLIASYPDLSALIRSTYGGADGTHFYLPDGRGLAPVGYKSGDANFGTLGGTGGEKTHLLTAAEMPEHNHQFSFHYDYSALGGTNITYSDDGTAFTSETSDFIGNRGGGGAHNNLQPYRVRQFIIKT